MKPIKTIHEGESLRRYLKGSGTILSKLQDKLSISYQQLNNYLRMEMLPDHFKLLIKDRLEIDFETDVLENDKAKKPEDLLLAQILAELKDIKKILKGLHK